VVTFKFIPNMELYTELIKKATKFKELQELDPEWAKQEFAMKKPYRKK